MFCLQETDSPHSDPFANEEDPLGANTQSESSDDEPNTKRIKLDHTGSSSLNLKVYQIPAYKTPSSLSIFPSTTTTSLPKFVNNPLNLANPLALAANNIQNAKDVVKSLHSRYSLPAKLTITPVPSPVQSIQDSGGVVRYKKNGEVAKKRGPPKGYKRKPKDLSQSFSNGALLQAQNTILTSLLAAANTQLTALSASQQHLAQVNTFQTSVSRHVSSPQPPPAAAPLPPAPVPRVKVPDGMEPIELELDPEDWFPAEPYRMSFSRKKNPKWKGFLFQCEHCFKGYRVASTLVSHSGSRHGAPPRALCLPCPCCSHISLRSKQHKKHLATHKGKRHRLFCLYCLPPANPDEPYVKESEKYPFDRYPQYWYASEESLRLHRKRKHPYAGLFTQNWFGSWGESIPNS